MLLRTRSPWETGTAQAIVTVSNLVLEVMRVILFTSNGGQLCVELPLDEPLVIDAIVLERLLQ